MNCSTHPEVVASSICIHCGRGLCSACCTKSSSSRIVCSSICASALDSAESALNSLRSKSARAGRAVGFFTIASGLVFAGFGAITLRDGIWQLAVFLFTIAGVFEVSGVVFLRSAKRKEAHENAA